MTETSDKNDIAFKQNILISLSYDGTSYHGSQSQIGCDTIEDTLKAVVSKIHGKKTTVYFSSRTDAGVHANGQTVNFYTDKRNMSETNWFYALNSCLPLDIRVLKVAFVEEDFSARRNSVLREYLYRIIDAPMISALDNRYAAHYSHRLNEDLLQQYCDYLVGEHDFTSFCSLKDVNPVKIRYIRSITVKRTGDLISITIIGNAFLHNMIRIIIGTILKLHRFEMEPSEMAKILAAKDRRAAGPTYKAHGLTLNRVMYHEDELNENK